MLCTFDDSTARLAKSSSAKTTVASENTGPVGTRTGTTALLTRDSASTWSSGRMAR